MNMHFMLIGCKPKRYTYIFAYYHVNEKQLENLVHAHICEKDCITLKARNYKQKFPKWLQFIFEKKKINIDFLSIVLYCIVL
jgi:hypothetical protein